MKIEKQVNTLWSQLQDVIDASSHDGDTLCDYKTGNHHHGLDKLLSAAIASERGHRSFVGGFYPVSVSIGAKIVLLSNFSAGATKNAPPSFTLWLQIRRDAAEAITLGYILREDFPAEWVNASGDLDYSAIMNPKEAA